MRLIRSWDRGQDRCPVSRSNAPPRSVGLHRCNPKVGPTDLRQRDLRILLLAPQSLSMMLKMIIRFLITLFSFLIRDLPTKVKATIDTNGIKAQPKSAGEKRGWEEIQVTGRQSRIGLTRSQREGKSPEIQRRALLEMDAITGGDFGQP